MLSDSSLLTALRGLELYPEPLQLHRVNPGAINRNYRLDTGNGCYFVKVFGDNGTAAIDRKRVFELQQLLSAKGLAARPVYLDSQWRFQIEQWQQVDSLTTDHVQQPWAIEKLANTLTRVHQLTVDVPLLKLPQVWQHYLQVAGPRVSAELLQLVNRLSGQWQPEHLCLCHNDLSLSHISAGEQKLIFDWEYAGAGNRYFDVACCLLINQLTESQSMALQQHYAQCAGLQASVVLSNVSKQLPYARLTADLWYLAQGISPN